MRLMQAKTVFPEFEQKEWIRIEMKIDGYYDRHELPA